MRYHEDHYERQEGYDERRVQLVEFGQLGILFWLADVAAGVGWAWRPRLITDTLLRADLGAFPRAGEDSFGSVSGGRSRLVRR
jgi:hypothetical protein